MSLLWIVLGVMFLAHSSKANYDCFRNNPCTDANMQQTGLTYFPTNLSPFTYIACMEYMGKPGCFVSACDYPARWNQLQQRCVSPSEPENIVDMREYNCFNLNPCTEDLLSTRPDAKFRSDLNPMFYVQCSRDTPTCRIVSCSNGQYWNQLEQRCNGN